MKAFTYSQYIKCIHRLRLNAVLQLAESSTDYKLNKNDNKHDKLVKNILKNKNEMAKFINDFLEPRVLVKSEDLIRYTNSYITKKYKSKEADLVYKLKNQEIFFLVEHQSTIKHNIPYRMLNYCIDIIQEWSRNKKVNKNINYPIVVPIILYTGNQKWKIPNNFREKQISSYIFERYKISLEYNLIDINKLSNKFLLEKDSMFGYGMLLEKAKDKEELKNIIEMIIKSTKKEEYLDEIASIILYLLDGALEESTKEQLLEKIDRKVGDKKMSSLYQRLVEENIRMIKQGKSEGRKIEKNNLAKNMLNKKFSDELIIEMTNITKEELEKIKRENKKVG